MGKSYLLVRAVVFIIAFTFSGIKAFAVTPTPTMPPLAPSLMFRQNLPSTLYLQAGKALPVLSVSVYGGSGSYKYIWSLKQAGSNYFGDPCWGYCGAFDNRYFYGTYNFLIGAQSGDVIHVEVIDAVNNASRPLMSNDLTVKILPATSLVLTTDLPTDITYLAGSATPDIKVAVTGGSAPYKYVWETLFPGATEFSDNCGGWCYYTDSIKNVSTDYGSFDFFKGFLRAKQSGVKFRVRITDSNGSSILSKEMIVKILAAAPLQFAQNLTSDVSYVLGGAQTPINVAVTGGTEPYHYIWEAYYPGDCDLTDPCGGWCLYTSSFQEASTQWGEFNPYNMFFTSSAQSGMAIRVRVTDAANRSILSNYIKVQILDKPLPTVAPISPTPTPASCNFNGQLIKSGSSVLAYSTASVPAGSACISEYRLCTNGALSGKYTNSQCVVLQPTVTPTPTPTPTVAPMSPTPTPAACNFNGQLIKSGSSVLAYSAASVPAGSSCISEYRLCTNGALSGKYTNSQCVVLQPTVTPTPTATPTPTPTPAACNFNGQLIKSGSSVLAYSAASVPAGSSCISEYRLCTNGALSGKYTNSQCVVLQPTVTPTPTATPTPTPTPAACNFNGQLIKSGSSVLAYSAASVPAGSSCISEYRLCTNGALSGKYTNSQCVVLQPTPAPVIQFSYANSSVNEASGSQSLIVSLSSPSTSNVSVNYTVSGGTASNGADYSLNSGTLTIIAGATYASINVSILNDAEYESTETVVVSLANPTNAVLGSQSTHTLIINSDDAQPAVEATFSSLSAKLFQAHCTSCHGSSGMGGVSLNSYAGAFNSRALLYNSVLPGKPMYSYGGLANDPNFVDANSVGMKALNQWIANGAPNN